MRVLAIVFAVSAVSLASANLLEIPMDTLDPAGYFRVQTGMDAWVETEGDRTFIRTNGLSESTDWPGSPWYYAPIIDFEDYTGGYIDATDGLTIEFDVRYYQEGIGDDGSEPYDNCSFGVQLFSAPGTGNKWWASAFPNPEPHGEWHHLVFDLSEAADVLELATLRQIEIHGSNARHRYEDHIDLDNFVITPEPSTLGLLAIGLFTLIRRR